MKSLHDVFMFSSDGSEQYVGMDYARGIHCTQWFAQSTETETVDGKKFTTTSKRNHWFSAPGWSDPGCAEGKDCMLQVPVRTVAEGTVLNHATGQTTKFHDHYEYVNFIPGAPPPVLFDPEGESIKCASGDGVAEKREEALLALIRAPAMSDRTKAAVAATREKGYDASKGMPKPPDAYTVYLEVNKEVSKETTAVREYMDFNAQRMRTDVRDGNAMTSVIRDFVKGVGGPKRRLKLA